MRVLVVTTSRTRLRNLKAATERVGGGRQFWFATLDQIKPETVLHAPLWQLAGREGSYALLWQNAAQSQSEDTALRLTDAMQPTLLPPGSTERTTDPAVPRNHGRNLHTVHRGTGGPTGRRI